MSALRPYRIAAYSYPGRHGSRSAQVRDRRLRPDVERGIAREKEGVNGRAPEAVPPRLGAARAEADDAVPARLLRSHPPLPTPAARRTPRRCPVSPSART